MTNERRAELLVMMEHCILNDGFCDECIHEPKSSGECKGHFKEFFEMVKEDIRERERMKADLAVACTQNNPCLVCSHYRPEREGLEKCELNNWVCKWEWRGEKHG